MAPSAPLLTAPPSATSRCRCESASAARPPPRAAYERTVVQRGGSIGNGPVGPALDGPALGDEPFQMRERLGDGEPACRRLLCEPEQRERHLVPRPGLRPERGGGAAQALAVVADQLARPLSRAPDRVAVAGERD